MIHGFDSHLRSLASLCRYAALHCCSLLCIGLFFFLLYRDHVFFLNTLTYVVFFDLHGIPADGRVICVREYPSVLKIVRCCVLVLFPDFAAHL